MFRKKGQEGGGPASVLVILMAIFIVLYVMLLPPEYRQQLLEDGEIITPEAEGVENKSEAVVLLLENPGRVYAQGDRMFGHAISPINLFTKTEGMVIEEINSIQVKSTIFSSIMKEIKFDFEDVSLIDTVLLSFNIKQGEGRLVIKINGELLFDDKIKGQSIEPILIKKNHLNKENVLEFSVYGPGLLFWRANGYMLDSVKVTADLTDVSQSKSTTYVYLPSEELTNLEKVDFTFSTYCSDKDIGILKVKVNGNEVFNAIPRCGMLNKFSLPPGYLFTGNNKLEFEAEKGAFSIHQIRINLELSELQGYSYYFELLPEQYDNITGGGYDVQMNYKFLEKSKHKEARIIINNNIRSIDVTGTVYASRIGHLLDEGFNSIKIKPSRDFEIRELKVTYFKKD